MGKAKLARKQIVRYIQVRNCRKITWFLGFTLLV